MNYYFLNSHVLRFPKSQLLSRIFGSSIHEKKRYRNLNLQMFVDQSMARFFYYRSDVFKSILSVIICVYLDF